MVPKWAKTNSGRMVKIYQKAQHCIDVAKRERYYSHR